MTRNLSLSLLSWLHTLLKINFGSCQRLTLEIAKYGYIYHMLQKKEYSSWLVSQVSSDCVLCNSL